jgi:cell division protein FtsW
MSAITVDVPSEPAPTAAPAQANAGHVDWALLLAVTLLVGLGLLMMLSASSLKADADYGDAFHFLSRQVMGLGLGLVGGMGILAMPWRLLRKASWWAYFGVLVALLLVFTPLGHLVNGSYRWIKLGPVNLQPSEFAKLALILVLANYLAANEGRLRDMVGVLVPAIGLPVPILMLVLFEPDFGSSVILVSLCGLMLFLAGLQKRWLFLLGIVAVVGMAGLLVLEPYRVARLVSFRDPWADPDGSGYQVVQGWIALASGGPFGEGIGSGVAQRGFLPEAHTDFISAVIGEELGAAGWIGMIGAYLVVIWRGTHISTRAPDLFGMLVGMGLTTLLGMQAIINLGVVIGWLPAKGLVLPFMSYGSSAVTVHILAVAILLRIALEGDGASSLGGTLRTAPKPAREA